MTRKRRGRPTWWQMVRQPSEPISAKKNRKRMEKRTANQQHRKIDKATQPLSSLCLAKQLLFFCRHWLVLNRHETFVKAMACMMRYQQDRLQRFHEMTAANPTTEFDINESSIRQEILYNLGRGFACELPIPRGKLKNKIKTFCGNPLMSSSHKAG